MNLEEMLAAGASAPTPSKDKLDLFDPSLWPLLQVALETFQMFDDCMKRAFDKTVSEGSEYLSQ